MVKYYDVDFRGTTTYIFMEYVDNRRTSDLWQLMKRKAYEKENFLEKKIWELFYQITKGLQYMHFNKILHRDLKPANVFLSKAGVAKLGDFGLCKPLENSPQELARTKLGTKKYWSYE